MAFGVVASMVFFNKIVKGNFLIGVELLVNSSFLQKKPVKRF